MSSSGGSPLGAIARRPVLWAAALGAGVRHLPAAWWRGRRGLAEARPWIRFRLETAYGAERRRPTAGDVVTYLRWCRSWPRVRG